MKIFISWSSRSSREFADALREFIPLIIQRAQPFTTTADIEKGSRWMTEISEQLDQAKIALICVTPESLDSPWLAFEAGALSKSLSVESVIPVLVGLSPVDLTGPLIQFQSCSGDKDGIRRILRLINDGIEDSLPLDRLNLMFEALWPQLAWRIESISADSKNPAFMAARSDRDLLKELIEEVRTLKRRINEIEKEP